MSWKTIKIQDIGEIITGNTPPKKDPENYGGDYPFLKPTDMEIGQRYTWETAETYSQKAFEKYKKAYIPPLSTCVVTIGTLGEKISLTHDYCFTNQSINSVIPDQKRYDPFFVFYLLKNNLHKVKHANAGTSSGREHVNKTTFSNIQVDVPIDISTQRRIASILSAYDGLIENNLQRIRLLEEAAQNIYREWFVHFRFPGHEQAQFGEDACPPNGRGVPVGWEVSTFFEKVDIMSGGTPKTSEPSYWNGDIPFFTPKDASSTGHLYITETQKKLTEEGLTRCNSKLYPKDTVFITARGTVGKVRLAMTDMAMNQSCYALKMSNGASQFFLVGAIHEAVAHLKKTATGGVFDTIIVDTFKQIPIVVPKRELIELYHSTVTPIFKQTECLQNQNIRLKEARDILLPRLMNRTIEV